MTSTFPKLLRSHAQQRPNTPAIREKKYGIWQTFTWQETEQNVRNMMCGLASQGIERGDHIVIIGDNRPRLSMAMIACQALGAVPIQLYQDAVNTEYLFPINNAEVTCAIVENQEQVDKILEIQPSCPSLQRIIYDDPRGLRKYQGDGLCSLDQLLELGEAFAATQPTFYDQQIELGQTDDIAALFFTSGTTGNPKGVVHSFKNLILSSENGAKFEGLSSQEEVLAYLPPAWIGQNIFSFSQWLVLGYVVNCPESNNTVIIDLKEIGPSYYFAPPRVFEDMLTRIMIRMEDASFIKRQLFDWAIRLARRVGVKLLNKEDVGLIDRIGYALANFAIYAPLRNSLGMSRTRIAYTAGEAIGPDLFSFYRSIGINLKQLYGSTETAVFVCIQPDHLAHADTVGQKLDQVEVDIRDREILVRAPYTLIEYYKNPEATREAKDAEGWFHTGDAGFFDQNNQLRIIDRSSDVGSLKSGALFAPKFIENKLKFFSFIKEAVAFGDGRDQVCVFVNIDFEAVGNWAEKRNLPYAGYIDLAGKREVESLIHDCIVQVNQDLSLEEALSDSRIQRFIILHKELDADDGELTRTRKVRRGYIAEKYADLIKNLYNPAVRETFVSSQVRYEDGRSGLVEANLRIIDIDDNTQNKEAA